MISPKVAILVGLAMAIAPTVLMAEAPVRDKTAAAGPAKSEEKPEQEFFLVQDDHTARCAIMKGRTFGDGTVVVGHGHKSWAEALASMRAMTICRND